MQQLGPGTCASQQVLIVLNLATSAAYLNYHYLWCFVLLAMISRQHLKVYLHTNLFQSLKCSSGDLADGVSDYHY